MEDKETTALEVVEAEPMPTGIFASDPVQALGQAEALVRAVSKRCTGRQFIVPIGKGDKVKQYPKVEWWTTVGAVLGLFPVVTSEKESRGSGYVYIAKAEVRRNGTVITSADAICSTEEKRWSYADEYAVKSMAQTRAVAKAYRIGLSFLAVLAGLEPTPAEEVSPGGFDAPKKEPAKPKLKKTEIELAKRMHEYLLAKMDQSQHAVEEEIKAIGKKLDIPEAKDGKFNGLTGDEINSFWQELCAEVEEFEGATNGKGNSK